MSKKKFNLPNGAHLVSGQEHVQRFWFVDEHYNNLNYGIECFFVPSPVLYLIGDRDMIFWCSIESSCPNCGDVDFSKIDHDEAVSIVARFILDHLDEVINFINKHHAY